MKVASVKVNFLMNSILTMSSFIFPLITFPYVCRILLPEGTGRVSFALSFISYFSMFAQLGVPAYGTRACAKVRDDRETLTRVTHELLAINVIMCVISYIALFLCVVYIPELREDRCLYVITSLTIILTSIGMEWLYRGLEQYTYITIRSVVFKFIALIAMFVLIHKQSDYVIYGGISIFAASASNILNFINVHKYIDMRPVGNYNLKRHLKPIGVFFAMACATTIYTHLDTVMLGFMATVDDVGYYTAAVKIKLVLVAVVTSLGHVLLPRASYYVQHGLIRDFQRITVKGMDFVLLFATPLMIYFIIFAPNGIYFLSGLAFEGAIIPMKFIMPTILLIGITNLLGMEILIPLGREKVVLYSEIAGAIVNVVINAILIPQYAASGAAIGTLVAEIVVLIVQAHALQADLARLFKPIAYGKIIGGLVLGIACSYWVSYMNWSNFMTLLTSGMLFMATYGLFLLFAKEKLVIDVYNQLVCGIRKSTKCGSNDKGL